MRRADWHLRANAVVVAYLAATIAAVPVAAAGAIPRWMVVHLLLLGAVTNAIFTWTGHFAAALSRAPQPVRRGAGRRLAALNLGVVGVLVGVGLDVAGVTVAAAAVVAAVVGLHLRELVRSVRRGLGGGFTSTVRFYWAAAVTLLVGIAAGTALAIGVPEAWYARVYAAHAHVNLFGWVGLTVLGTLFTLWPTVLRTRAEGGAVRAAGRSLPACVAGLALSTTGLLAGTRPVIVAGAVLYAVGAAISLDPFVRTAWRRPPRSPAAWMLAAGTGWLLVALGAQAAAAVESSDPAGVSARLGDLVPWLLTGFVAQVLTGALTYLLPVVLGGGPAGGRRTAALLDRWGAVRTAALNAGVALIALPLPAPAGAAGWLLITTSLAGFVVLAVITVVTTRRRRTMNSASEGASSDTDAVPPHAAPPRAGRRPVLGGLAIGAAMLLVAVGVAASGERSEGAETVSATGSGTRVVEVSLVEMDIVPGEITVDPGTRVVLEVTNDGAMRHDLSFPGGEATRMLEPGESERLDLGTVYGSRTGWCTVPGHKAAGMVMTINVTGDEPSDEASSQESAATIDPNATPGPDFRPADAALPPAGDGRTHHVTLRAGEQTLPVAPGVNQRMWTFGGTVPGPTLRGKVGDTFVITLINDASMGHSIDFHAAMLAPDAPFRTIEPGERLTFEFTAHHAGAWMYHCATDPMVQHIGNGMYGAVIVDPPGLEPVDAEYALVQSELYLGPDGEHGDFDAMAAGNPDAVVFNGYYDQYRHAPLTALPGDRVRVWLVNAGLERPSAFHVIGTQFDTVWQDGAYLVRPGNADSGAAQALALQPGQGGFVEFSLPEAGHYPFLTHVMVDAERGATGLLVAEE